MKILAFAVLALLFQVPAVALECHTLHDAFTKERFMTRLTLNKKTQTGLFIGPFPDDRDSLISFEFKMFPCTAPGKTEWLCATRDDYYGTHHLWIRQIPRLLSHELIHEYNGTTIRIPAMICRE